jgi:hypothetical protein
VGRRSTAVGQARGPDGASTWGTGTVACPSSSGLVPAFVPLLERE